ncbi:MAG: chromate efflux transporter [Coraliomargarita sp.]
MKGSFEVFRTFLLLGCCSFGGPAAHLGYFRKAFVEKRQWLDEKAYAGLIALCQFLPGPSSSQIGFAIGLRRAGLAGGIAAFLGFTIPSFLLLFWLSTLDTASGMLSRFDGAIHGLKLFAVVVVADATLKMGKSFCQDRLSVGIATATAITLWCVPGIWVQMTTLVLAAIGGLIAGKAEPRVRDHGGSLNRPALVAFFLLLFAFPLFIIGPEPVARFADFYQAGSMVFGGGHVVLPLLQGLVGDALPADRFLTGYAAAQAVPGPMFSLAAFLGSELMPASRLTGALIATLAIFLPGFLLVLGVHDRWEHIASHKRVAGAIWGINAAVVGFLAAALYTPVFVSAVYKQSDMALLAIGFFLSHKMNWPIVPLIAFFALAGLVLSS